MDKVLNSIAEWLKEILVGGIVSNLSGMFDSVNSQVGEIAGQVGATPQAWNGTIYSMVRTLSDNVIIPIAGVILAFVMTTLYNIQNGVCRPYRNKHMEHRNGRIRCGAKCCEQRRRRNRKRCLH